MEPKKDGIDHINIYSRGKAWLGRELSNFAPLPQPIEIPIMLMTFDCKTIEGAWYIHRINDSMQQSPDAVKFLEKFNKVYDNHRSDFTILQGSNGLYVKRAGRKILKALETEKDHSDWFKKTMKDLFRRKVEVNPALRKALVESELPFAHYYYYGKEDNPKVIPCPHLDWVVEAWEAIRKELRDK